MQFNLNFLVGLDELPDKLSELISGKEKDLSQKLGEIQNQLSYRKINGAAILKNISEVRKCLALLDQELQTYSQAISSYEAAVMSREALFLQQQLEEIQKEQEQQEEHDD
tara:strand:+ start:126 stop:455 length:330 start_codon:yes stop_codon:yes gene_type:complete